MGTTLKDFGCLRQVSKSNTAHSTIDGVEGKLCGKCGEWHPLTEFFNNKNNKDGKAAYCKCCMKEYAKKKTEVIVGDNPCNETAETHFDELCRLTNRLGDARISEIADIIKAFEDWGLQMVALTEGLDGKEVVDSNEISSLRDEISQLKKEKEKLTLEVGTLIKDINLRCKDLNRLNDKDIMTVLRSENCKPRWLIDRIAEISPNYRITYHDPTTDMIMPCIPDTNNIKTIKA